MLTVADLIDEFGGSTKFAAVIGKGPSTASEMKRRQSIPVEYWPSIIRAAPSAGIEGLTTDELVRLHVGGVILPTTSPEAA
jgi:hypothetical protein